MEDPLTVEIKKQVAESTEVYRAIQDDETLLKLAAEAAEAILKAYRDGKKVLIAGNGGSAADAQHLACEVIGKFYLERAALPCIALTTNTSVLTAVSNDFGYDKVFVRQVEAFGREGDVFIGLSTSGNSANVLEAIRASREKGLKIIGLTGDTGGKMSEACDICIRIPSTVTPRIQESHILIGHIIFSIVEAAFFGKKQ